MIDFSEIKVFKTKKGKYVTYEDILRDIYNNSSETRDTISTLVDTLTGMISSPQDAILVMEAVTEMLQARVKNDDLLVKVASIVARIASKQVTDKSGGSDWEITDEEKKQLLQEATAVIESEIKKDVI